MKPLCHDKKKIISVTTDNKFISPAKIIIINKYPEEKEMLEITRVYSIDEPNTMAIERNSLDLRITTRTNQFVSKVGVYPVFCTNDLFYNVSDTDIPIYLVFIGEDIQFYQVTVRNRHLSMCPLDLTKNFKAWCD